MVALSHSPQMPKPGGAARPPATTRNVGQSRPEGQGESCLTWRMVTAVRAGSEHVLVLGRFRTDLGQLGLLHAALLRRSIPEDGG